MAQVNVTIAGRSYKMACDDGQEGHLAALAERVDRSIAQLRERFGEIGEQRLTVMAAITFADQQADAEERLNAMQGAGAGQIARDDQIARAIATLAERIEAVARRVGGEPPAADEG